MIVVDLTVIEFDPESRMQSSIYSYRVPPLSVVDSAAWQDLASKLKYFTALRFMIFILYGAKIHDPDIVRR